MAKRSLSLSAATGSIVVRRIRLRWAKGAPGTRFAQCSEGRDSFAQRASLRNSQNSPASAGRWLGTSWSAREQSSLSFGPTHRVERSLQRSLSRRPRPNRRRRASADSWPARSCSRSSRPSAKPRCVRPRGGAPQAGRPRLDQPPLALPNPRCHLPLPDHRARVGSSLPARCPHRTRAPLAEETHG